MVASSQAQTSPQVVVDDKGPLSWVWFRKRYSNRATFFVKNQSGISLLIRLAFGALVDKVFFKDAPRGLLFGRSAGLVNESEPIVREAV